MIEFVGLIILAPLFLLADWFVFLKKLEPLDAALTKASHGMAMMLMAGWAIYLLKEKGYIRRFPYEYGDLVYLTFAFLFLWGAFWLFIGAARSRQRRDHHYLGRAIAKVGLGTGLYFGFPHYWHATELWEVLVYAISVVVAAWCVVTGLTKVALLMRPLPRLINGAGISDMPHGDAGFSRGLDG